MPNNTSLDSIVSVEPEGATWRVHVSGWGSFPIKDQTDTVHISDAIRFALAEGERRAFAKLRNLIGAAEASTSR